MKVFFCSIVLMLSALAFGQMGYLENGGFENWTYRDSTVQVLDWNYVNVIGSDLVQRIENGPHQNYACRLETIQRENGDTTTSYLAFGDFSSGSFRPAIYTSYVDSLVFWGRWNMAPGDTGMVQVIQYIDGNPQPVYHKHLYAGVQEEWTRVAIRMISPAQDSLRILIHTRSYGTDAVPTPGSYLELDNVHFVDNQFTPDPLPNFSFESWYVNKYEDPDGFYSLNQTMNAIGRVPNTNKTTDAYDGEYAVKLTVDTTSPQRGVLTNAKYFNWQLESGAPYSAMPDSFSGFYKADVINGDSAYMQIYFSRNDTIIWYWSQYVDSTVGWTPINLSIDLPSRPDSMRIYCRSSNQIGSALYLDEFYFHGGDLGMDEVELSIGLYPNPTSDRLTIHSTSYLKQINVLTLDGTVVQSSRPQSNLTELDIRTLPSGTYFVQVLSNEGIGTSQFVKQ